MVIIINCIIYPLEWESISCVTYDVLTLFWNQNELLEVTKMTLVDYFHYLL